MANFHLFFYKGSNKIYSLTVDILENLISDPTSYFSFCIKNIINT